MTQTHKKYWFKRRFFGLGWVPTTWEGWSTLVVLAGVLVLSAQLILPTKPQQPTGGQLALFFAIVAVDIATLVVICLIKGPKPRWRWGNKPSDNPDEDFKGIVGSIRNRRR